MNANTTIATSSNTARSSWSRALAVVALSGLLAVSTSASADSVRHGFFMQGQVLSVNDKTVTICIGKLHGAEVGQVLQVIRHEAGPYSPKVTHSFTRKSVGSVRIASVFDEHYSTAEVIGGKIKVNDTVELDKR